MELYSGKNWKLYNGNMLDMLQVIEPCSIDSIVTDPPYELNFMGKGWDNSGIAFQPDTWRKCYQVLKSGGYLLAFGGSRTFHRIAVAIEDAGFEIRDVIMWLYGSGFPKSMNIGKAVESKLINGSANTQAFKDLAGTKTAAGNWGMSKNSFDYGARPSDYSADGHERTVDVDYQTELGKKWNGWGTALKPAYEPIIVARKPCVGSTTDNVIEYGVGALNIDGCRIGTEEHTVNINDFSNQHGNKFGNGESIEKLGERTVVGRFPSNTILTYDNSDFQEVCGCMQVGFSAYEDSGSASRYFYCAKASKKDRDEGLEGFNDHDGGSYKFRVDGSLDGEIPVRKNLHPTVKPTELMQYLIRLVTPKGGRVLDPFNGSGSTGKAVMYENNERGSGYEYVGIELTAEYIPITIARIQYAAKDISYEEYATPEIKEQVEQKQMSIFDFIK